jgi:CubicO group peptidase (beta-lactamase class C family)
MTGSLSDGVRRRCPRHAICAAVMFGCLSGSAQGANLDAVLASAMEGTKTPALSILVMRSGRIAQAAVRGVRRIDRPLPARPNDVWLIGSDAKPMTAALIARLVDRGLLSWSTPLAKMLPDLASAMRPQYRNATLVQLLTHRSGLPENYHDLGFFNAFLTDTRPLPQQRYEYVARALTEPPLAAPGAKFSYSNTGFVLAAVIAERRAGATYEQLVRREIFGPLKMRSAGFGVTPAGQPQGHHGGRVATLKDSNPAMFAPAGNIYMSLPDWSSFCLDQMAGYHGNGKLLKTATYRRMETRVPGTTTGLSWGVPDSVAGRKGPALTHSGSDGNWMALVVLFPQTQNGVLVAANAAEDMGGDKAAKMALKAVLPELAPPANAPVK